jgi:hypothetical protein
MKWDDVGRQDTGLPIGNKLALLLALALLAGGAVTMDLRFFLAGLGWTLATSFFLWLQYRPHSNDPRGSETHRR